MRRHRTHYRAPKPRGNHFWSPAGWQSLSQIAAATKFVLPPVPGWASALLALPDHDYRTGQAWAAEGHPLYRWRPVIVHPEHGWPARAPEEARA